MAGSGLLIIVTTFIILSAQGVRDTYAGAIGLSAFGYLFWLVGWHSAVRLSNSGVTIDNLLARHTIPWNALEEITAEYGLIFRLTDGKRLTSIMYGGSIIGNILKYRYTKRVATMICSTREKILDESGDAVITSGLPSYRRQVHIPL